MNENKKFSISNMMLAFITVLVVIGLVALAGFFLLTPPDDIIMGQAEATQVRISGKVPGRIASYRFGEGDQVKAGDTLVFLDTPEVMAKLKQAEAARAAAEAQNAKAIKGAREQEITAAYEMWQKAQAGLTIAKKSFDRIQNLYEKGVMSAQKRDEVEANYNAMVATEKAARSQYEMAKEGAREEDKGAAYPTIGRCRPVRRPRIRLPLPLWSNVRKVLSPKWSRMWARALWWLRLTGRFQNGSRKSASWLVQALRS